MRKLTLLASVALLAGSLATPASAGSSFNPLGAARTAVDLGLDTAERAVDLGIETAEEVGDGIEDVFTPDNCPPGKRYKGRDGKWHTCR
jgi:hypothetical protein